MSGPADHPTISNSFLFQNGEDSVLKITMMADAAHIIKNIRNQLYNNKIFILPDDFVQQHGLVTNVVDIGCIKDLLDFKREKELDLAPHLPDDILNLTQFKKMDVGLAVKLLSRDTAAAIRTLVAKHGRSKRYLATAAFFQESGFYYDIVSSRSSKFCFHKNAPETNAKRIEFLKSFMNLYSRMKLSDKQKDGLKPTQLGVLLTTTSLIELQEDLLNEGAVFFLPGRTLQDSLESFQGNMRRINSNPTPLQFMRNAKRMSIGQILSKVRGSSYGEDDSTEFLTELKNIKVLEDHENEDQLDIENFNDMKWEPSDFFEEMALSNLGGYLLAHTIGPRGPSKCSTCAEAFILKADAEWLEVNFHIREKEYKEGSLTRPSKIFYEMIFKAESLFRCNRDSLMEQKNITIKMRNIFVGVLTKEFNDIPLCCLQLIFTRFSKIRLHFYGKHLNGKLQKANKKKIQDDANASKTTKRKVTVK